ncbi:MAG: nucleotidyltransferase domain-containing protein [Pseudomonadota bacterium]
MNRQAIIDVLVSHFAEDREVVAVYLYGSVAKGNARAGSDVDVGVLYRAPPPRTLLGQPFEDQDSLTGRLERPVQLVVMNDASPDLVHRILRDGMLILETDRRLRVAFEVQVRNAYYDLLPVLREYRAGAIS